MSKRSKQTGDVVTETQKRSRWLFGRRLETSVMDKTPEEWSERMRAQHRSARTNAQVVIVLLLFGGLACGVSSIAVAVDSGITGITVIGGVISLLLLSVSIAWIRKLR